MPRKKAIVLNNKEFRQTLERVERLQNNDIIQEELKTTVKEARRSIKSKYNPYSWMKEQGSLRVSYRKNKSKNSYTLTASFPAGARFLAYLEWGTRNTFSMSNLRDAEYLMGKNLARAFARQFKAVPFKKATNVEKRPFFFNSIRDAVKKLPKRIKQRIKKK